MLQKLRDQTQSLFFKVLVGAIIITLAIFGFGAFNLFVNPDPAVATVNGDDITQNRLMQEAERERRRMALQMGENFSPDMIDPVRLQNVALDQLIARMLLAQAADDLNIGTSSQQVSKTIVDNPNFLIDGQFDEASYRRVVQMMGYTPQSFMDVTSELLTIDALRAGILDSAFLTDRELRQHAKLLNQQRDLAYLPFTVERFAQSVDVAAEDIELRYQENQLDYMTEESVDVQFVELAWSDLTEDPSIEVSDDDLLAAYEADKAANPPEEKRDARHILLEINDERDAEQAHAELLAVRERLEAGESFAELARELSEDPGSAQSGGELGAVGRGVFVAEFEDALWALEVGELSEPVQTEFGYHLIQLNEVLLEEYPPFAELSADIESRLRREQAQALFIERFRELDSLAFEQPDAIEGLAEALDLDVQTVEGVTRTAGSGVFGNVDLREAVFTDDVLLNGYNSPAVEYVENRAVVARVLERHEPAVRPLAEVEETIREEIVTERARSEIRTAQAAALARVEAGESVAEVAADAGAEWQTVELARRNQPGVPREVLAAAFDLERPEADGKAVAEASSINGDRYVVTVTRVVDGDVSAMTESEITSVRNLLARRASSVDFEGFYDTLEADASIRRPEL